MKQDNDLSIYDYTIYIENDKQMCPYRHNILLGSDRCLNCPRNITGDINIDLEGRLFISCLNANGSSGTNGS